RTWEQGATWDQEVDPEISARFMTWMEEIRLLSEVKISRWLPGFTESKMLDWYYRRFSQYKKIVRLMGWMLRFFNNSKTRQHVKGELTAQKYNAAEMRVLLLVQQEAFNLNQRNEQINNTIILLEGDDNNSVCWT
ncbi:hypothetical protein ILUMI_09880, partial [Ignelater luminosus]